MALTVNVGGPVLVSVGSGSGGALEELGYTVDGVRISETVFTGDVPSDERGGSEGPPIEVQQFGITHRITLELSRFDQAVMVKIALRARSGSFAAGDLVFSNSNEFRVLLEGANFVRNYLYCTPREPIELNAGSKFTRTSVSFEAHYQGDPAVLYNSTTS